MRGLINFFAVLQLLQLLFLAPATVNSKAILGVDLGSLYMKVALVQRNSPLEIVTNLHSQRKTEQMVLFDEGSRFYGADASSLLARKPHLTPAAMSLMLGRGIDHPSVMVLAERHYPIRPSFNESRSGVCLTIDGNVFTPEELVAMVLAHAKDITVAFGGPSVSLVRDCVLTVPCYYTQHERQALLDAATLAELNVLALIDENTAAALHYGMDRVEPEPQNVLFYNMGGSALQVSIITFFSYEHKDGKYGKARTVGAFEVKGKGWDASLGGEAFDARLVDYMADEFNRQWNAKRADGQQKDVRAFARSMTKIRIQANKVKHVLSANNDIPVFIDSLQDDVSLQMHVNRAEFEQMSHDLLLRSVKPIEQALKAAGMTVDDIHSVELIGGGMRIPKVQEEIDSYFGSKLSLGMHINSDESMALGAAFHGANVSTAFRVRHVGMTDVSPFPIAVTLENAPPSDGGKSGGHGGLFGIGKKKKEKYDDDKGDATEEAWQKHASLFKSFGKVGIKKTIAFTHDRDVQCSLDYVESEYLPQGTALPIVRYNVTGVETFAKEMGDKGLGKPKVSLHFELSSSGISRLIKAEASVEETVVVQEAVEVDEDEEDLNRNETADADSTKSGEEETMETASESVVDAANTTEATDANATEGKKGVKKKKTKLVDKEQKKIRKRQLDISAYYIGNIRPYSSQHMAESIKKLEHLSAKDKARMMLEAGKNKFESYIYLLKNKLIDDEERIREVTNEEQRESLRKMAEEANEWLDFDGWDADIETFERRYDELSAPAEEVFFRVVEATARPEAVEAVRQKLSKIEELVEKWATTMPHITEEERSDVSERVAKVRKQLEENEAEQATLKPWEAPVFRSAEIRPLLKPVESLVGRLGKKPKPKPVVEDVNEGNNATENISKNETDNVTLEDAPPNQEGRADESMPSDDLGDSEQNGSEDNTADEL